MIKVVHLTRYCHVAGYGGTERYVLDLIGELRSLGVEGSIAWLCQDRDISPFESEGIRIIPIHAPRAELDPFDPGLVKRAVAAICTEGAPSLMHVHTLGIAETEIARALSASGVPYAFTFHSPAWTCRRHTLLRWGRVPCDGEIRTVRCSACKLHERSGLGPALAVLGALASAPLVYSLPSLGRTSFRRRTMFTADTYHFRRACRRFLQACGLVVSCCDWSAPLLRLNGARADRILACPQGVSRKFVPAADAVRKRSSIAEGNLFTIGYVGRVAAVKGVDIVIRAVRRIECERLRMQIIGWKDTARDSYAKQVKRMADEDKRIELVAPLAHDDMIARYGDLSLVVIPSVWRETGPLVLFEALQTGVPVWTSRNMGQQELVEAQGRVIEPNTVDRWQSALQEAVDLFRRGQWSGRRVREQHVRTMADVAREMRNAYERLCARAVR